jgi:hypothetical protein
MLIGALIVGASAGGWNGWAIAGGCTPEQLARMWLDPATVTHPYRLFYFIWKLSFSFGTTYAHHSLGFEALTANLVSINRRYKAHAGLRVTDI